MPVNAALSRTSFLAPFLFTALLALAPTMGSAQTAPGPNTPTITGTPETAATVGRTYSFRPTASDVDGDALTFSVVNKPSWAYFNRTTGRLYGAPPSSAVGSYGNIVIRVSDGRRTASLPAFSITVSPRNRAPTISGTPPSTATAGRSYSFLPNASDRDGDTLSFSIANKPAWASFSRTSGRLVGTPPSSAGGTYSNIVISVSDGRATASLPAFSITVSSGNRAPTISGTPASNATVGQTYSFVPTASDPDGDAITFSVVNKPTWAAFSTATGRLSGTPAASHVGTYNNIVIRVSDGRTTTSLPAFSIRVATRNRAPTISGSPASAASVGTAYSFSPTASDPDGDSITFSIVNKPSWAVFSAATGRLSGTPGATTVGAYSNITISVSDGRASTSLPPFSITVSSGNRAPTISGTPANRATVGTAYSFRPTASDADGDALSFSISNKPAWAVFDPTTGRLSGTPASSAVGTYANIAIRVSDGRATTALPAFNIEVAGSTTTASVTLRWVAPTTNTDGTPLRDLAGYEIHYGNRSQQYDQVLRVPGAAVTSAVIENLGPATWYFAVLAYTSDGLQSEFSAEASKTIR